MDFSNNILEKHHQNVLNEWQTRYSDLIQELLQEQKINSFVDIGANTGGVVEFLLQRTSIKDIYAFEPVEENYNLLEKKINLLNKDNKFNFKLFQKAIFYGKEKVEVWGIDNNTGTTFPRDVKDEGFLSLHNRDGFSLGFSFDCTTLEKELHNIENIDLCKIDVEGSEWNIIKNSDFLKTKVKTILLEYHWFNQEQSQKFIEENLPMFNINKICYSTFWLKRK